jgi:hypothetical protein
MLFANVAGASSGLIIISPNLVGRKSEFSNMGFPAAKAVSSSWQ